MPRSQELVSCDYRIDFDWVVARVLTQTERAVFDTYFRQDLSWRKCTAVVRMNKGTFFHAVYRIERKIGLAIALMESPLRPLHEQEQIRFPSTVQHGVRRTRPCPGCL